MDNTEPSLGVKYARLALVTAVIVALDQLSKALVLSHMPLYGSIEVIPGLFRLTHIHNPGGAFGFLAGMDESHRRLVFLFVSSIAAVVVLVLYHRSPATHPAMSFGFALIFAGALGNLIDRFRFGIVVDFLDFFIGRYHWPAFNIADSAITVGITIFVFHVLFRKLPD